MYRHTVIVKWSDGKIETFHFHTKGGWVHYITNTPQHRRYAAKWSNPDENHPS